MDTLHHLLMKTQTTFQREVLDESALIHLTPGQPKILEYLHDNGESNQKAIAEGCLIEQATVGSILLRMENAGLIQRRMKVDDRRALYVSLTAKGEEAALSVLRLFDRMEEKALKGFSAEDIECLKRLLSRLYDNFKKED